MCLESSGLMWVRVTTYRRCRDNLVLECAFFKKDNPFYHFKLYVCVWVCTHGCSTHRGQRRVLAPMELYLEVDGVSCLMCMLRTEFGSSGGAVCALNC